MICHSLSLWVVNITKQFFFATPIVAKHSGTNLVIKTADHETDSITLFINLIETYDGPLSLWVVIATKQFFFATPIVAKHSGTNLVIKTGEC